MEAITIVPGMTDVELKDFSEPKINSATQVKIKIIKVGICGTDREEAIGGRADSPNGHSHLGLEMFGRVVETGSEACTVAVGDLGVFSVRRGVRMYATQK